MSYYEVEADSVEHLLFFDDGIGGITVYYVGLSLFWQEMSGIQKVKISFSGQGYYQKVSASNLSETLGGPYWTALPEHYLFYIPYSFYMGDSTFNEVSQQIEWEDETGNYTFNYDAKRNSEELVISGDRYSDSRTD